MKFKFLTPEEERNLTTEELKQYYLKMRSFYKNKNSKFSDSFHSCFHNVYGFFSKYIRNYELEIRGIENIPLNDNVIFACNHSNANDTYTMHETFQNLFRPLTGSDCLNIFSYILIGLAGGVFIDREDKISSLNGTNKLIGKIISGSNAVIFPEATWCLHPAKPLLPFKLGIIKIAMKTNKKIVPVVFDYHEVDEYCNKENQIIDKCIVQIGNPIEVKEEDNIYSKLEELRSCMATMLWLLWEERGVYSRKNIDPMIYENHNELKINTPLFRYNCEKEEQYIYHDDDYIYSQDQYPINRVYMRKVNKKNKRSEAA